MARDSADDYMNRMLREAQNQRERQANKSRKLMDKIESQRHERGTQTDTTAVKRSLEASSRRVDALRAQPKTAADFEKRARELVAGERHKQGEIVKKAKTAEVKGRRAARNARRRAEYALERDKNKEIREASKHLSYSEITKLKSQLSSAHRSARAKLKQQEQQTNKQLHKQRVEAQKNAAKAEAQAKAKAKADAAKAAKKARKK